MIGVFVLLGAGICQGSFGIGMKKIQPYSWEAFRLPFAACSLLLFPLLTAGLLAPGALSLIVSLEGSFLWPLMLCGFLWGVTAIFFDQAILQVGLALTYGIAFGISASLGSLLALPFTGARLSAVAIGWMIAGTVLVLGGVWLMTKAGRLNQPVSSSPSRMKKGVLLAVLSGLGSAAMNIGYAYASPLTHMAQQRGATPLGASLTGWIPIFWGGFLPTLVYTLWRLVRLKTYRCYGAPGSACALCRAVGTSALWFLAMAGYSFAVSQLGAMGPVTGWAVFTSLTLMVSHVWAVKFHEWQEKRAMPFLYGGNALLLFAFICLAAAQSAA